MVETQTTITPHSQKPLVTRTYPSTEDIDGIVKAAHIAQKSWGSVSLEERIAIGYKFMVYFSMIYV